MSSTDHYHYSGGATLALRSVYSYVEKAEYRTFSAAYRVLCPDGERRTVTSDVDASTTIEDQGCRTSQRGIVYVKGAAHNGNRQYHRRVYGRVGCIMERNEYTLAFVPIATGKWADLIRPFPPDGPSAFDAGAFLINFFAAPQDYARDMTVVQ